VAALPDVLGVTVPPDAFSGCYLTWDDVRALASDGVTIAAHTCTHPILTRVSPEQAGTEIGRSRRRIEDEVGTRVHGLAYPNGQPGDFDEVVRGLVADAGIPTAFTLLPGPARAREVREDPLAIRRACIGYELDLDGFVAKTMGVRRLLRMAG
jgi:peptidoglycan/xylan/chitin deacetylase (PgdA/CDA1 family)